MHRTPWVSTNAPAMPIWYRYSNNPSATFCTKPIRTTGWCATRTRPLGPPALPLSRLALASYPVGVERGFVTRAAAVEIR